MLSEMIRGSLSRVSSPPCCAARVQEGSSEAGDTAETAEGAEGQRARMFGSQFAVTLKKCPQRTMTATEAGWRSGGCCAASAC